MRKKPNLIPRMERCAQVQIKEPENYRGKWAQEFEEYKELHLELGCGKGRFTANTALQNPDTIIIAVEKVADAMIIGMERVCDNGIENVRFIDFDAAHIKKVFAEGEVNRIYINFCDPWHKRKDADKRLTAPGFLKLYKDILTENGEIWFKTDNNPLFEYSLKQFKSEGWELREVTRDLHENGPMGVMTDYEAKFYEQGIKINRCVAIRPAGSSVIEEAAEI